MGLREAVLPLLTRALWLEPAWGCSRGRCLSCGVCYAGALMRLPQRLLLLQRGGAVGAVQVVSPDEATTEVAAVTEGGRCRCSTGS